MHRSFFAIAAVAAFLSGPVLADPILLGTTPNPAPAPAFMADQYGIFKKHGVDIKIQIVAGDPTIPAALVSNSIQVAAVTGTTFLNAVASGIDIVALTGTSVTRQDSKDVAIVASTKSDITDAKGFEGKAMAIPGIGAVLDVMLKAWLLNHGADVSKIKFIEVPLPAQADQLKAGRVDGLISVDQFAQRMVGQGAGKIIALPLSEMPNGQLAQAIVATRGWAESHPDKVAAIRASMKEAEEMARADPEKIRAALGKAMRLPPPVTARIALPFVDTSIRKEQFDWWLAQMKKQGLISTNIDTAKLILR